MKKPLTVVQVSLPDKSSGQAPDLSAAFESLRVAAGLVAWQEIRLIMVFELRLARLMFPLDQLDRNEADAAITHWNSLTESKALLHTLSDRPLSLTLPPALSRKKFAALLAEANHLLRF